MTVKEEGTLVKRKLYRLAIGDSLESTESRLILLSMVPRTSHLYLKKEGENGEKEYYSSLI